MDPRRLAAWRMHTLALSGPALGSPKEVVGRLVAVQAQDYGPAMWSVGMRTTGVTGADLDAAIAEGTILRTHLLRPTWHAVLPGDVRWLLQVTAPRVQAINASRHRELGLTETVLRRGDEVLAEVLRGGIHLTRTELGEALERSGIATDGQRLPYLLMHAELEGVLCSGPRRGTHHTYALLDERVPAASKLTDEAALIQLVRRYVAGHGPTTARDLQAWSSLTLSTVRDGLGMLDGELDRLDIDGVPYWFTEPAPTTTPASPTVHLLQAYDEYLMGYRESRDIADVAGTAVAGSRGLANGVVVLDTQMAGRWRRRITAREVHIEVQAYAPLDGDQHAALMAAAERHGAFLDRAATVTTTVL